MSALERRRGPLLLLLLAAVILAIPTVTAALGFSIFGNLSFKEALVGGPATAIVCSSYLWWVLTFNLLTLSALVAGLALRRTWLVSTSAALIVVSWIAGMLFLNLAVAVAY